MVKRPASPTRQATLMHPTGIEPASASTGPYVPRAPPNTLLERMFDETMLPCAPPISHVASLTATARQRPTGFAPAILTSSPEASR